MNRVQNTLKLGGAQGLSILISFIKTKALALILGPSGIAVLSLFQSYINVGKSVLSIGASQAIPKYFSQSKETTTVKNFKLLSGIYAFIVFWTILVFLSFWIISSINSKNTLDYINSYTLPILFATILLGILSEINIALLQSFKQFKKVARITIYIAFLSLIVIPFYYFFGTDIIPYMLLAVSLINLIASVAFLKLSLFNNILQTIIKYSIKELILETKSIFRFGILLIFSTFLTEIILLHVKTHIHSNFGQSSLADFQSAWFISNFSLNMLLTSMLTHYYPEMVGLDNRELENEKIGEQFRSTLMFGFPIILMILLFADELLVILYSKEFYKAKQYLELMIIGSSVNLIAWPLNILFLAKGQGKTILLLNIILQSSLLIFISKIDFYNAAVNVGISYVLSYLFFLIATLLLAYNENHFLFKKKDLSVLSLYILGIVVTFYSNKSELPVLQLIKFIPLITGIFILTKHIKTSFKS